MECVIVESGECEGGFDVRSIEDKIRKRDFGLWCEEFVIAQRIMNKKRHSVKCV
jgi:hypothetical protein